MPISPDAQSRSHRSIRALLGVALTLTLPACGGTPTPAPTTPPETAGSSEPADRTESARASGLPGLAWGASAEAVLAVYPRATATDGGLWYVGMAEDLNAVTKFTIGGDGLEQIHIEWIDGFISMDDCATGWRKLRTSLDGRFGPSGADNLAAYWKTASASITLACNPNDSNAGVLSLTYALPTE